jgi:diazepam-binding inhibitor (GABA receptor modulator, acyl-CoA-binding protein)
MLRSTPPTMLKLTVPKVFSCHSPIFITLKNNYMEVKSLFEKAVDESEKLSVKPSNETLLQLYSLYKQATVGDVDIVPPTNPFDFVAKAKYEAWQSLKGKSKHEAQMEYINLVNKLKS